MSQTRVGDGDLMLPAYCALMCQSLDPRQLAPGSSPGASLRRSNWTTGAVDSGKRAETFYNQFSFSSCEDLEVRGGQQEKGK